MPRLESSDTTDNVRDCSRCSRGTLRLTAGTATLSNDLVNAAFRPGSFFGTRLPSDCAGAKEFRFPGCVSGVSWELRNTASRSSPLTAVSGTSASPSLCSSGVISGLPRSVTFGPGVEESSSTVPAMLVSLCSGAIADFSVVPDIVEMGLCCGALLLRLVSADALSLVWSDCSVSITSTVDVLSPHKQTILMPPGAPWVCSLYRHLYLLRLEEACSFSLRLRNRRWGATSDVGMGVSSWTACYCRLLGDCPPSILKDGLWVGCQRGNHCWQKKHTLV